MAATFAQPEAAPVLGPARVDTLERFTGRHEDARSGLPASLSAFRAGTTGEIAQAIAAVVVDPVRLLARQCLAVAGGFTAQ
jgi:hypothetical protein